MTGPHLTDEARDLAAVLWDHHRLATPLEKSNVVLVLGSHDHRVAEHSAQVWRDGWAPLIVFSGGHGKVTETWEQTEARTLAGVAERLGVPRSAILLEETATNTGENITAARDLLRAERIPVSKAILVSKPYMARRAYATAAKRWPEVTWLVSTADMTLADYTAADPDEVRTVELMVGDLQRLRIYADLGFQIPVDVPEQVWAAYERLTALGFDRYVIT